MQEVGAKWLATQGARVGFVIGARPVDARGDDDDVAELPMDSHGGCPHVRVSRYSTLRIERKGRPAELGVLDYEGVLEVQDSAAFGIALARGFGRAKAFGCGLMLIRRT